LNKRSSKNLALLQPLQPPRGLTGELVARLAAEYEAAKLALAAKTAFTAGRALAFAAE